VRSLESRESVTARIRCTIDLFGKRLLGSGTYEELRSNPGPLIRLDLRLQLGDQISTLVQVCDGHHLWTYRKLLEDGEGTVSKVDLARVTRAIQAGSPGAEGANLGSLLGLGGLPRLLRGLQTNFHFPTSNPGRLEQIPVWVLDGQWKPIRLVGLLPGQKDAIQQGRAPDFSGLAPHLPDQVLVFLGQGNLFPYRVEYRRSVPLKDQKPGEPASRTLVWMDLIDVSLNVPIDPSRFRYNPGNVKFSDQTPAFIQSLGRRE